MNRTLHAWLELCRLSNAPTIVTNVLVGVSVSGCMTDRPIPLLTTVLLCMSMLLLYVGGMALNDVVDYRIDNRERPHRPIPSGRIVRGRALLFVNVCFAGGAALMALAPALSPVADASPVASLIPLGWTLLLIASIVLYNLLHTRFRAAFLLMGACRALVYVASASVVGLPEWSIAGIPPAAAMVYITLLTVIASAELSASRMRRRWLAVLMAVFPIGLITLRADINEALTLITAVVFVFWTLFTARHVFAHPPRTPRAVMGWLAGICLMDACFLAMFCRAELILLAAVCFIITLLAHRRIAGS